MLYDKKLISQLNYLEEMVHPRYDQSFLKQWVVKAKSEVGRRDELNLYHKL